MKLVYPAVFHKTDDKIPYFVEIPDLDAMTQGTSVENAIEMAREIICIKVIELQKSKATIPTASDIDKIKIEDSKAFVSLVYADVATYKRSLENRCIKKNCTVPIWLNDEAEKAGINFSQILQKGLKAELGINN